MATMTFEEFKDEVFTRVRDARPDLKLRLQDIHKSNGVNYTGISIVGQTMSPVINVNALYIRYNEGKSVANCVDEACDILEMPSPDMNFAPEEISRYEVVKEFIHARLVPKNEKNLALPHTEVADLLLIYAVRLFADKDGVGEGVVNHDLLSAWDVDIEDVHHEAMNTLMDEGYSVTNMGPMTIISTQNKTNGAVAILCPQAMSKFENYYILPSSVNEVIVLPKDTYDDPQELATMVRLVNETAVEAKDKLSDNVYEFRNGKLEVA